MNIHVKKIQEFCADKVCKFAKDQKTGFHQFDPYADDFMTSLYERVKEIIDEVFSTSSHSDIWGDSDSYLFISQGITISFKGRAYSPEYVMGTKEVKFFKKILEIQEILYLKSVNQQTGEKIPNPDYLFLHLKFYKGSIKNNDISMISEIFFKVYPDDVDYLIPPSLHDMILED
jgi:hypothetical protein